MIHKKTLIALAAAVALGCVPVATNALAAGHQNNGHGGGGPVYYNAPIYDSCAGYGYGECPGYGVPIVGAVINSVLGGYGGY